MSSVAETRTARKRREAQEAKARKRSNSKFDLRGRADALGDVARNHPGPIIAVVVVVLAIAMLYGPTRNYYVAWRSGQDLQAYYTALAEQNEALMNDVERLTSQEGIEDEARRRGLIKEDETGVVVEGLPDDELARLLEDIELEDTRPWYIKALDVVFFYSRDSWQ